VRIGAGGGWWAAGLVLMIDAEAAVRWSLVCEAGGERLQLSGSGPVTRSFATDRVDCRIGLEAGDSLIATLIDGQANRSRAQVSGVGSVVQVRAE
jgi:hypothetical protein